MELIYADTIVRAWYEIASGLIILGNRAEPRDRIEVNSTQLERILAAYRAGASCHGGSGTLSSDVLEE